CPPFTDLRTLQTLIDSDKLAFGLGAQDCFWEDTGAYTGEVSPLFLAKLNVGYVIVGHSERRELFGDTDEWVNRKLRAVLRDARRPTRWVGGTRAEREGGETGAKRTRRARAASGGGTAAEAAGCTVAYEPIWAIGTGRNATPEDADETCGVVRAALAA